MNFYPLKILTSWLFLFSLPSLYDVVEAAQDFLCLIFLEKMEVRVSLPRNEVHCNVFFRILHYNVILLNNFME